MGSLVIVVISGQAGGHVGGIVPYQFSRGHFSEAVRKGELEGSHLKLPFPHDTPIRLGDYSS
jgi:hypothetical protein